MAKKDFIVDGIKVKVDPKVFEDFGVLEIFAEMQEPLPQDEKSKEYEQEATKRGLKAVKLVKIILGDQKDKVIEALREKNNGVADAQVVFDFITKIIETSNTAKK